MRKHTTSVKEPTTTWYAPLFAWVKQHPYQTAILTVFVILSLYLKIQEVNVASVDEFVGSDPSGYLSNAANFFEKGEPVNVYFNPLVTLYLICTYAIFGTKPYIARIIQVLVSFALPFFLYMIARKYFGRIAAICAAVMALVHPNIVYYSAHLWTEFWLIFLFSLMMFLYVRSLEQEQVSTWLYVVMGIAGSLGAMSKLWALPAAGVFAVAMLFHESGYSFKKAFSLRRVANAGMFVLGILIILLPWNIYASAQVGYPVYLINTNSGTNLFIGNNPDGEIAYTSKPYDFSPAQQMTIKEGDCKALLNDTKAPKYNYYMQQCAGAYAFNYIKTYPGRFAGKLWQFTTKYWLFPNLEFYQRYVRDAGRLLVTLWVFWVLGVVGILVSLKKWKRFVPFYLMALGAWFYFAISFYLARYKAGLAPLDILFAAGGLAALYHFFVQLFGWATKEKKESKED